MTTGAALPGPADGSRRAAAVSSIRGRVPARLLGSTPVLGVLAAVLGWSLLFYLPGTGIDPSWQAALYMGAHQGLLFGTQAVFTYGPLGFLNIPGVWFSGLGALAFVYSTVLYVLLAGSLVWQLRQTIHPALAVLATAALLSLCGAADVSLVLVTVWCLAALGPDGGAPGRRRRAEQLVVFGGAVIGAVQSLVELRSGPLILVIAGITLLARGPRARNLLSFAGCAAVAFFAAWFAGGQTLGNLGSYISTGAQIVSGYSQAMGFGSVSAARLAGTVALVLLVIVLGALSARPGRPRAAAILVLAIVGFAAYKEGVIREDFGHLERAVSTLVLAGAGVGFGRRRVIAGVALLALFGAALTTTDGNLNPVSHVRQLVQQVRWEVSPGHIRFDAGILMAVVYRIDRQTLAALRGHRVAIDPWEAGVAWLYNLHWQPLPVFQDYSAYTRGLDRLNADALSSRTGPQRLLREDTAALTSRASTSGDVDNRLPAWDPPAQAIAMLCHFKALRTTARWEVLTRIPNRCGDAHLLKTVVVRDGQPVALTSAPRGEVTYARVAGVDVAGLEQLRTLLYRARDRFLVVNRGIAYRLVPGTADDGLVMDAAPGIDYPAPFALAPQARTIAFHGVTGPVTVRLYALPVRPLP